MGPVPSELLQLISTGADADNTAEGSSDITDIVSNFQDLSAVLSLFAADTVESKFSSPSADDWERMSTAWSIFGIIGAVRAYLKLVIGLDAAEKAGLELYDLGGYTSRRTKEAQCTSLIGSKEAAIAWQDDRLTLLGEVNTNHSSPRWKRPFMIVIGYSRCPFEGAKASREIIGLTISGVVTLIITCIPLLVIRTSVRGDTIDNVTLACKIASSLVSGFLLPILLQALNNVGVACLRDLPLDRFDGLLKDGDTVDTTRKVTDGLLKDEDTVDTARKAINGLLKDGDTVITTRTASVIFWQSPGQGLRPRSGDLMSIRLVATLATITTLASYILNYIELGRATTWRAYTWLGIQATILVVRFVLWALQPAFLSHRERSVVFAMAGSLDEPLLPDAEESVGKLHRDVVRFAAASATSSLLNKGGNIAKLDLDALDILSDVAPADILVAKYCDFEALMRMGGEMRAIRLPWSWMEEIYAGQGLILGNNPWAIGGLYLAAVVQRADGESPWSFKGLTTIHQKGTSSNGAHGEDSLDWFAKKDAALQDVKGVTANNYGVSSLVNGEILAKMPYEHDVMTWHEEFRENVRICRASAVSNGPPHQELHVCQAGTKRMSKMVASLKDVLKSAYEIVAKEKDKDHSECRDFCTVFGF
ncbi:hypothetical protein D9758_001518 [Tetrapyrgos nigripes]|uniref:Uncharacterized protein n=1 Tax=Tetrapyrgos nigripes TaxID=182062 RepID=A0A8H5GX27_9AGAR|nr:hypothetical protein D9758_001518 [Tetrapyrgos nigripes]